MTSEGASKAMLKTWQSPSVTRCLCNACVHTHVCVAMKISTLNVKDNKLISKLLGRDPRRANVNFC